MVPTGLSLLNLSSALNGSFFFSRPWPVLLSFTHVFFSHYNSFPLYCIQHSTLSC